MVSGDRSTTFLKCSKKPLITFWLEKLDPVPASQPLWNVACLQLGRDQEYGSLGLLIGDVKSVPDLSLNKASTVNGLARETDEDDVSCAYRSRDLLIPILPWQKLVFVKPRVNRLRL